MTDKQSDAPAWLNELEAVAMLRRSAVALFLEAPYDVAKDNQKIVGRALTAVAVEVAQREREAELRGLEQASQHLHEMLETDQAWSFLTGAHAATIYCIGKLQTELARRRAETEA